MSDRHLRVVLDDVRGRRRRLRPERHHPGRSHADHNRADRLPMSSFPSVSWRHAPPPFPVFQYGYPTLAAAIAAMVAVTVDPPGSRETFGPLSGQGCRPRYRRISLYQATPRPGFEPGAYSLGGSRSIQLSYRGRPAGYGSAKAVFRVDAFGASAPTGSASDLVCPCLPIAPSS